MKKNSIPKIFYLLILIFIFFIYSFLLISAYTNGDQRHYRVFYEVLKDAPASEAMLLSRAYVGASEPLTTYLFWSAAQLDIDKDIFVTILNIFLLSGLYLAAKKHDASFAAIFLLLTNFYTVVLMTGAERLKVAYILLIWAIYFSGRKSLVLIGISPLAHLQNFIIFPSLLLALFSEKIKRKFFLFINKQLLIVIFLSFFIFLVFFMYSPFIAERIIAKVRLYTSLSKDNSITELANITMLIYIAFVATTNRWRMSLLLLPLYPAVLFFGGMRVNMIAVTLVLYFLMKERRLNHPLVMILLIYFSIKSISFINKIFLYGNGFANI